MQSFWGEQETHKKAFSRMSDIFHQDAFSAMSKDSSKMRSYQLIKGEIGLETYLTTVVNIQNRKILSKFRLSNHNLMIEKGRHLNINKNLRFCPFCPKHIEDEMHFLLECTSYASHRKELTDSIKKNAKCRITEAKDKHELFINLLSKTDITPYTAQYLMKAFHTRDYLLKNCKNFT